MKRLLKRLAVASSLAALMALTAGSGTASAQKLPNCTEATNLESIVDDSGSMSGSDRLNGRRQLIEILTDLNRDMIFGGVEFGDNANALFPPTLAANGHLTPAIAVGLGLIQADNGSTNYNAGFALANSQNPAANARMFLSDGEHNAGTYTNGHRNAPFVKTYVVGFGSIDPTILNVIATETGGPILVVNSSTDILAAALKVSNALNCDPPPIERTLQFNSPNSPLPFAVSSAKKGKKKGQSKNASFRANGSTAEVVVSHGTAGSVLKLVGFKQGKKGVRRTVTRGENYTTASLRGLKKGKVRFQVQAKKLAGDTTAVLQITP